jgi:hypothetical protein
MYCEYEAYIPDLIAGRNIVLDGDVAADVADAELAIARLDGDASALVETEALARILLRAESVASSRIEGLQVGVGRLLRAEAERDLSGRARDVTATEVLANIDAMQFPFRSCWRRGRRTTSRDYRSPATAVQHRRERHAKRPMCGSPVSLRPVVGQSPTPPHSKRVSRESRKAGVRSWGRSVGAQLRSSCCEPYPGRH